jgi:hypothetical protein
MNGEIDFISTPKSILNENYCVAMGVNSETIFLFWKFSNYIISSFENLLLDKKIIIKVFDCDKNTVAEMDVDYLLAKIYIKIPPINFPSHIRIYVKDKDGNIKEIAVSNEVILSYEREIRKEYNYLK